MSSAKGAAAWGRGFWGRGLWGGRGVPCPGSVGFPLQTTKASLEAPLRGGEGLALQPQLPGWQSVIFLAGGRELPRTPPPPASARAPRPGPLLPTPRQSVCRRVLPGHRSLLLSVGVPSRPVLRADVCFRVRSGFSRLWWDRGRREAGFPVPSTVPDLSLPLVEHPPGGLPAKLRLTREETEARKDSEPRPRSSGAK